VQRELAYTPPATTDDPTPATLVLVPMAADTIEIDEQRVSLLGFSQDPAKGRLGKPVWRQKTPGAFEAVVVDADDRPVARIERTYSLMPGSYLVRLVQRVVNLTERPLKVRWYQFGPADLEMDSWREQRRVRFGYVRSATAQAGDPTVLSDDFVLPRANVLGAATNGAFLTVKPVWPNPTSERQGLRLVWAGMTNRYFAAAVCNLLEPSAGPDQKVFAHGAAIDRIVLPGTNTTNPSMAGPSMAMRMAGEPIAVPSGGAADLSMGLFAGPLSRPDIERDPLANAAGLSGLVVYNYGGMCGWCTFGFLTSLLLGVLRFLDHYLVFDWGLAIILLVVCVRTILHPVTKWSQIRMQRFGKQMQNLAPKQKKIQEKFADDPQRSREEMAKLWREEGISPAGFLGCLPGFLQSPVWIALSAMLYFAIELRHQPAFFGVFQRLATIPGLGWMRSFLGDLAEPDRFIDFGRTIVTLPILSAISSINVLPILLGVVFFIQQKYLTPPSTTPLSPEQEQQQKIMKVMMVVMFPVMMYSQPSGLVLYFVTNSTLAILESRYIRSHIDKYDLLNTPKKAGRQPGGFLARLQAAAEERQKQLLRARGSQGPGRR
jgi:YidC/Oxa1 family membrane protein insertase